MSGGPKTPPPGIIPQKIDHPLPQLSSDPLPPVRGGGVSGISSLHYIFPLKFRLPHRQTLEPALKNCLDPCMHVDLYNTLIIIKTLSK